MDYDYNKNKQTNSNISNYKILVRNIDKIHTTELGVNRIRKNLNLDVDDVVLWCKDKIKDSNNKITRKGKNWYVESSDIVICISSYSYTIITAHRLKLSD